MKRSSDTQKKGHGGLWKRGRERKGRKKGWHRVRGREGLRRDERISAVTDMEGEMRVHEKEIGLRKKPKDTGHAPVNKRRRMTEINDAGDIQ